MSTQAVDCPCPKAKCERHGDCEPCREYHYAKGKLPYCERDIAPTEPKRSLFSRLFGPRPRNSGGAG